MAGLKSPRENLPRSRTFPFTTLCLRTRCARKFIAPGIVAVPAYEPRPRRVPVFYLPADTPARKTTRKKPMPNAQKELIVSDLRDLAQGSKGAILTDYRGLTVAEVTRLRAKLRESNAEYHIVKNTLYKIALGKETVSPELESLLTGPTAILFAKNDVVAPTKAILDFLRDLKKPDIKVKGGYIDGKIYNVEQVTALSKLPSREQIIATLIGTLDGPAANFVGTLDNIIGSFVRTIQAIADKVAESGPIAGSAPESAAPVADTAPEAPAAPVAETAPETPATVVEAAAPTAEAAPRRSVGSCRGSCDRIRRSRSCRRTGSVRRS